MRQLAATFTVFASLALPSAALAQAAPAPAATGPALSLDLNALQPSNNGCRLTFVVANTMETPIERAAFEMALFNKSGVVDRLTVLDFKGLPAGKTKVSRFDLSGLNCADVSRVLINEATQCTGEGTPADACSARLHTISTSGLQFGH